MSQPETVQTIRCSSPTDIVVVNSQRTAERIMAVEACHPHYVVIGHAEFITAATILALREIAAYPFSRPGQIARDTLKALGLT